MASSSNRAARLLLLTALALNLPTCANGQGIGGDSGFRHAPNTNFKVFILTSYDVSLYILRYRDHVQASVRYIYR